MTRIPYLRRDELGPEGQQLWDGLVSGQGDLVAAAGGGLAGPFNAFVTVPGAGRRLSSLGATLRFGTSIERRLSEIAIITTGARWQARKWQLTQTSRSGPASSRRFFRPTVAAAPPAAMVGRPVPMAAARSGSL